MFKPLLQYNQAINTIQSHSLRFGAIHNYSTLAALRFWSHLLCINYIM